MGFLAVVVSVLAIPGIAWGLFSGAVTLTSGKLGAATVNQGNKPTATVVGRDVTLTWTKSTLSTGKRTATGYTIGRTNTSPGSLSTTVSGSCVGTVAGTTCTDKGLPESGTSATTWTYAVTPYFDKWQGPASPTSTQVSIPGPTLSLSATSFTTAGGTTTATVANYFDTEVAHFCLAPSPGTDSTTCTGSGAHKLGTQSVGASGGTTTTSLTIPKLVVGTYVLFARGSDGSNPAGVTVTVKAIPGGTPTILGVHPVTTGNTKVEFAGVGATGDEITVTVLTVTVLTTSAGVCTSTSSGRHTSPAKVQSTGTWTTTKTGGTNGGNLKTGTYCAKAHDTTTGTTSAVFGPFVDESHTTASASVTAPSTTTCYYNTNSAHCSGPSSSWSTEGTAVAGADAGSPVKVRVAIESPNGQWWNGTTFQAGFVYVTATLGSGTWSYPITATHLGTTTGTLAVFATALDANGEGFPTRSTFTWRD